MTTADITVARHTDVTKVTDLLVSIYETVYTARLSNPFFSKHRFITRLHQHASGPRWEAAVGYHGTGPVGYAYGASRPATTGYWATLNPPPDDDFAHEDGERTFVLFELMILPSWRGTGASRVIHDVLLASRPESRVSLAVENAHPRVRALYERWGYMFVGQRIPAPDSPVMDIMWRPKDL